MAKILLTNCYSSDVIEVVKKLLPEGFTFESLNSVDKKELIKRATDADYFLASGRVKIDRDVINAAANLKMIQRTGVGTDTMDLNYLNDQNIPVYVNEGVNSESVAEHTLMLIFSVLRNLPQVDLSVKSGEWKKNDIGIRCKSLSGKTIGLVGLGNIGKAVARMLQPFNVSILYYKRNKLSNEEEAELNLRFVQYDTLLSESDIVSLHCPLSKKTVGMLGEREISCMKPGSFIINTARGQLINEEALIKALSIGHIAGAGLDVYQNEPIPKDSSLFSLYNVTLTPHTGGLTIETFGQMIKSAFRNIYLFHNGNFDLIKGKQVK